MCFEMASAMKKYFLDCEVECLVVSKTGKYGRKSILANRIAKSYGWNIESINYKEFYKKSSNYENYFVLQHRLECSRPLKFNKPPLLYLVINHTVQKLNRLKKFNNANVIVSVCEYLKKRSPKLKIPHKAILNGLARNTEKACCKNDFITGRCHRLPSSKFSVTSLEFLDSLQIENHVHYIIGPTNRDILSYVKTKQNKTCIRYLNKIDDQQKKKEIIRSFDVYFYDTYGPEGASVAILEALAAGIPVLCKKIGGNKELIKNERNGFYFENFKQAKNILIDLHRNSEKLAEMKKKTSIDFDERLLIEKCVNKYRKLMVEFRKKTIEVK